LDSKNELIREPLCERIDVLKVYVDIVPRENFEKIIFALLDGKEDGKKAANIVLLSLRDLLRARRKGVFRNYAQNAALIVPISKSIVTGSRFLTGKSPVRYMPFNFAVSLLTILEQREFTIYLLGGKPAALERAEKNIRQTFPKLRIVGRFPSPIKKNTEDMLLQVIRKSAPSLLLIGKGVPGGERWVAKNSHLLNSGLRLWCSDLYDVFAKRRKHPSAAVFERGLEWIGLCLRNPLRIFRVFSFIRYIFLLLFYKIIYKTRKAAKTS
jgi:N-acetylglucosaminyldiphosphoundecaprenol N-acetyl-beta-D-mannosaminyltransferase